MLTRFCKAMVLIGAFLAPSIAAAPTEVLVLPTIHAFHAKNERYTYDMVYRLIEAAKPDYVGVEIRSEDMALGRDYLLKNYPHEMVEVAQQWGARAFGFDWLGDDIAGKPLPDDWWESSSPIKHLERKLGSDRAYRSKALDAVREGRLEMVRTAAPESFNDGRYDALNETFYSLTATLVLGSKYQPIADFYADRDRNIDENIAAFIKAHPGKRVVIVTGADHRGALLRYLQTAFGPQVKLLPVL